MQRAQAPAPQQDADLRQATESSEHSSNAAEVRGPSSSKLSRRVRSAIALRAGVFSARINQADRRERVLNRFRSGKFNVYVLVTRTHRIF